MVSDGALRSYAEIDLGQIEINYLAYKKSLPESFEIIAVVKADAYGHGAVAVAKRLSTLGVDAFAVATVNEGIALRENGIAGEILILGYSAPECAEEVSRYGLTQTLVDESHAREIAMATDKRLKVQFAIDTGMKRIGLDSQSPYDCERAIRCAAERFELNGIFTHLAAADSGAGAEFTRGQIQRFASVVGRLSDLDLPYVHCLNTAGGIAYSSLPDGIGKFVRLGIALYGIAPSSEVPLPLGIRPALSWYATVSSVRAVKKGESVGYGFGYVAERDGIIATISVGYADGYSRMASDRAYVLIGGRAAPVVGRVCMDQMTVDVSGHRDVRPGDRVVLIGADGELEITAERLGETMGTIGYEVVCGISSRVERKYIN